jgi:hypothetical protein
MTSPRINTINKSRRIRPKKKSLRRKSKRSKPRKKSRAVKKSQQLDARNRKLSRCKPINRKSKKVRTRPKKIKNKRSVRRKTTMMDWDNSIDNVAIDENAGSGAEATNSVRRQNYTLPGNPHLPFADFPGGVREACRVYEIELPMKNGNTNTSQIYIEFEEGINELRKICAVYNNTFNNQPTPGEADEAVKFKDYFNETLNGDRKYDNFPSVVETIITSLSANTAGHICCNPDWIESFLTILETLKTSGDLSNLLTQYLGFDGANIELFSDIMSAEPLSMYRLDNVVKYVNYLLQIVHSLITLERYINNKSECGTPQGERFKNLEEITYNFYVELISAMRIFLELYTILSSLKHVWVQHSTKPYQNKRNTLVPSLQFIDYSTKCCVNLKEGWQGPTTWIIPKSNPPSVERIVNFFNKLTSNVSFDLKIPTKDHVGYPIKSYIKKLGKFIDATSAFSNIKNVAAALLRTTQENIQSEQLVNAINTEIYSTAPTLVLTTTVNISGLPTFVLDSLHDLSRISDLQIDRQKIKPILVANLNKLMSDNNYGPHAYSYPEQLSGLYSLMLKKEIDNQNNKDSLLILTNTDKPSQFELMTPDEYFSNDLPFNATASPPSISSIVGTAKTITAQDTNGKIGGKDSNIQCASNNTLCSIDAGGSSKNFDSEQQWFRLDKSLQQPVNFRIKLDNLIVEGNITRPGGIITVDFLVNIDRLTLWNGPAGSNIKYASIRVNNIKNTGIDNKTGAIISYIIHYIVTNGLGPRARAAGNLTHGWHSIEKFRAFFSNPKNGKQYGIPQPAELNKIAISKNCTLTIITVVFTKNNKMLEELYNNHIATAPLLLKFYGDQTFRTTASYASKLNQIYQAKTPYYLNQIFANNPANALTVNIASSDYIHFISTLCHDVGFIQNDKILKEQHTNQDITIPQDGTMQVVYNELPLLLGENIPGAQLREDSMAKPNITVILAQDEVQKTVLSAFCGRRFANDDPDVGEFMSHLAKSIINDVKNNRMLQRAYKEVGRACRQMLANAALVRKDLSLTEIPSYNAKISKDVNDSLAQLNNGYYEITIESLEQLYNINFDTDYPDFFDLDTSGTQYKQVKARLGENEFTPLKFKVKVIYTGYGFEDKINSNTLLTELMIDDDYTNQFISNIFNIGITYGTFSTFSPTGHDDGATATATDLKFMLEDSDEDSDEDSNDDDLGRRSGPFKLKGLILANHLAYINPFINPPTTALQPGGN